MKKLMVLCLFLSAAAMAAEDVFLAEIYDDSGVSRARAFCMLNDGTTELRIESYQNIQDSARLSIIDEDGLEVLLLDNKEVGVSHLQLSADDYDGLVSERLSLSLEVDGYTQSAVLKRDLSAHMYHVTITNLTKSQIFSPPVALSHTPGYEIFTVGNPAPTGLAELAEDGDGSGLLENALNSEATFQSTASDAPILPGTSQTITVMANSRYNRISVLGMLVSTNDSFFAAKNLYAAPYAAFKQGVGPVSTAMALVYDSGTEGNNEDCAYIPGPPCGNPGQRDTENAEGFVHIANGVHGIADLSASAYDWDGPAAMIKVQRSAGDK